MSNLDQKQQQELQDNLFKLQRSCKTLLLSTVNPEGLPEISYAPYIRHQDGQFYIFISELASHTRNLLETGHASVMFITDEQESRNMFARERLIYHCRAEKVERNAESYERQLDALEGEFGNMIGMLRTLQDFHLIKLQPNKGSYVVGFGKAFDVDPVSGTLVHIDEAMLKGQAN